MKNHLKRLAAPKTWIIDRKQNTFITRPKPGAHSLMFGLPLGIIIRDNLSMVLTMNEARKLLHDNEVLVDGKRRTSHRFITGLFDIISFPALKKHYRVSLDDKGRMILVETSDVSTKLAKIKGKKVGTGGKIQLQFHDGRTIFADNSANVGDTAVLQLPSKAGEKITIKEVLPLKEGVAIFLTQGKHAGSIGKLKEIKKDEVVFISDDKDLETKKSYLFVVGKEKSLLK